MHRQLALVLQRVLGPHQRAGGRRAPVVQAGQEEAQRRAVGQHRQRRALRRRQRPAALVAGDEGARGGDVEAAVRLEAPGVQRDADVVGQRVAGGEVEVERAGERGRRGRTRCRGNSRRGSRRRAGPRARPSATCSKVAVDDRRQARLHRLRLGAQRLEEAGPGLVAEVVGAAAGEARAPASCSQARPAPASRQWAGVGRRTERPVRNETIAAGLPRSSPSRRPSPVRDRRRARKAVLRPGAA